MSALIGHVKAFRALASAFASVEAERGYTPPLLGDIGEAFGRAADELERQAAAECTGNAEPAVPAQIAKGGKRRGQ